MLWGSVVEKCSCEREACFSRYVGNIGFWVKNKVRLELTVSSFCYELSDLCGWCFGEEVSGRRRFVKGQLSKRDTVCTSPWM